MATKTRTWTIMVLVVIVLSLWTLFQPIRWEGGKEAISNRLEFKTEQPLITDESAAGRETQQVELAKQLTDQIGKANIIIDPKGVEVVPPDIIRVPTLSTTREQFKAEHDSIYAELSKTYANLKDLSYKYESKEGTVVAKIGPLAIYKPKLHVRLGLDLQGGSHVLLQCMPKAEFQIRSKTPMAEDAEAKNTLRETILRALEMSGVKDVKVEVPDSDLLIVSSQPKTEEDAQREEDLLKATFETRLGQGNFELEKQVVVLNPETLNIVRNIIEQRVNSLGLTEPIVQTQGVDRIIVEMPGIDNPDEAIALIGKTASLEFRAIPLEYTAYPDEQGVVTFERNGETVDNDTVISQSKVIITGADLKNTNQVVTGQMSQPVVKFEIKAEKSGVFSSFTQKAARDEQLLAIVFDGKVVSAPVVKAQIVGSGVIEGMESLTEARDLAMLLNAGALPVPVEVAEVRSVSATLGADSIAASLKAGLLGLLLVAVFMMFYYRLPGIMAVLALSIYLILSLAVLVALGATLTLPGIAGFIMTIGMAVDANVLIFERLKEELRTDKSIRMAIEAAFHRAWTAILDGHVTTFLVGLVLYSLATGTVKGFAVTLLVGIVCNLFSAMIVTKLLMNQAMKLPAGKSKAAYGVTD